MTELQGSLRSSWLVGYRYDPDLQTLTLETNNGEYDYANVPPLVAQGLIEAPSPGKYYAQYIKGKYNV
jgi:hypothetical protein